MNKYSKIVESRTSKEIIERNGFGYEKLEELDWGEEINTFDKKHSFYKNVVKEVLLSNQYSTNNYFVLYMEVLRALDLIQATSGKNNYHFRFSREDLKSIPSPESICRASRALITDAIKKNNFKLFEKLIPQNPKVREQRFKQCKIMREYFRRKNI